MKRVDDEYDEDEYGPIDEGYGAADLPGFEPMEGPGLFDDPAPEPEPDEQTGPGLFADNNANLTAHNSFVLVIAEMGFVGYVIWLAFLGYGVLMTLAVLRQPTPAATDARVEADWKTERSLAMTLLLAQVGYLGTAFFLSRSYVILLYLLAALVLGWYTGARRRWPDLPTFSLGRDLVRWPAFAVATIIALFYIFVNVLADLLIVLLIPKLRTAQ